MTIILKRIVFVCLILVGIISCSSSAKEENKAITMDLANIKNFRIDSKIIPKEKLDTTLGVSISIRGLENPAMIARRKGMELFCQYLDSIGQKYTMQILDSGGSNDKEVDNMRQFAARGNGNIIVYSDPNEAAIAPALVEAVEESGGYIGTAWSKPEDVFVKDYAPTWVVHTSPDNRVAGASIAKILFDSVGGKGEILAIDGMLGNTAATDRGKGLDEVLAQYPDIKLVARDTGNWDSKQALALAETWLNLYPNVKGIWCANDMMALGVIQALDKIGKKGKVLVVGVDAVPDMVEAIKKGWATATVSADDYQQVGYILAIAYAAWVGQLDPAQLANDYLEFNTVSVNITKENVLDYEEKYIKGTPTYDFSLVYWNKAE